jgi:WXXGXW repeat (2 copies)
MRENKFNIGGLEFRSSEERNIFTEISNAGAEGSPAGHEGCTPASLKTGRGMWARRSMVSCLLGSLLLALAMLVAPAKSSAQVSVFVSFGPPAIPVYEQPYCPGPGYFWTPGYWAWDQDYGYFWVPGTWVPAPFIGAMWTPGYWGWYNSGYMWYPGYWGTSVGFYGGINYGYGYTGRGYYGGYWRGDSFYYNRYVNRITSRNITTVYNQRVVVNERGPRISYNGGRGGIDARATSGELAAARTRRFGADNRQMEQQRWARSNPAQRARENHGRPEVAATPRPGEFRGSGVVRATRAGEPYKEPPREVRSGREAGRTAPAQVERRPQSNAPRQEQPNQRMEQPAPRETTPNQRMERNAPGQTTPNQRMERSAPPPQRNERQVNRNNSQNTVQRNAPQARPQPQSQRPEGNAAPERQAHPQNQGKQEGGKDHNPGHGKR